MGAVCHVYASRYRDVAHEHVREHIAEHIAREQCEGGCFKRKVFELTLCLYKEVLCHVASGETRKRARQETRGADLRCQLERNGVTTPSRMLEHPRSIQTLRPEHCSGSEQC